MFSKNFLYRIIQPGAGLFGKCGDTQIANIIIYFGTYGADFYGVAGDGHIKWVILRALDGHGDV